MTSSSHIDRRLAPFATTAKPVLPTDVRELVCAALNKPELVDMASTSSNWRKSALASQHAKRPPSFPGFEVRTKHQMQLLMEPEHAWSNRLRRWRCYRWDNSRVGVKIFSAAAVVTGAFCSAFVGLQYLAVPPQLDCSRIPGDTCKLAAPQIVANARHWGADWSISGSRCLHELLRFCGYSSVDVQWYGSKFYYQGNSEAPDVTKLFGDEHQFEKTLGVAVATIALAAGLALALNHRFTLRALKREKRADIEEQIFLALLRGRQACCLLHPKQWSQQRLLAARLNKFIDAGDLVGIKRLLHAGAPLYMPTHNRLPLDVANAKLAEVIASGAAVGSIEPWREIVADVELASLDQRSMLLAQLEAEPPASAYRSILEDCLAHF